MAHRLPLIALLTVFALASPVAAEKVDLTPVQLRKTATHVVVGQVIAVYSRQQTEGDWMYTRYVAEVRVDHCEKGDGIEPGMLVYARYWRRAWIGQGEVPPSTSGHRGLPEEGASLRIYLARNAYDGFHNDNNDGGFNVIGANGFEPVKPPETLDVTGAGVKKAEANQTLIGFSSTRVFYMLGKQSTVVVIHLDNQKRPFTATGMVQQFAPGTAMEQIEKWVNNQHSDALYPDVAEPVATFQLPAEAVQTLSSKRGGQVIGGPESQPFEKYTVEFEVKNTRLKEGLILKEFKDSAAVYAPPTAGKSAVLRKLKGKQLIVGSPSPEGADWQGAVHFGAFQTGASQLAVHGPMANFAKPVGDFLAFVELDRPLTQEQIDSYHGFGSMHPAKTSAVLVFEILAAGAGKRDTVQGRLIGIGNYPNPLVQDFSDAELGEQVFLPLLPLDAD